MLKRHTCASIVLALAIAAASAAPSAADADRFWPQWRGPEGTGVSRQAKPPVEWSETKNIRWKKEIPGRGASTPVIWGDLLFLSTAVPVGVSDAEAHHVDKVLSILDVPLIKSKKFKVALDCCNGAGVGVSLRLLRALGCSVEPIHCTPDGLFPHTPEPNFINLQDLRIFTKECGADIGFATDPDADRIAVVDENGNFLGEELSLALSAQYVLSRNKRMGWFWNTVLVLITGGLWLIYVIYRALNRKVETVVLTIDQHGRIRRS